ncbi:NADH-ubiquinone oxidoreductase-F iron-sulfur binding region domain-containing protein [Nocardioides sp. GY 10127]|uniref:NADH-ubiquinone oxidoreductase-F iron-sulfur binding region domain-containing protein n=1 Tax=Nocardioides sp. GY 10127 TaxID=2569762 RepID=UPI0010A7D43A|nr:NADH-ubiquinone oxidoreductase-F iron-sulfur binding region domain-containing protein [Nocardioides sp. GY 10127]TIC84467.1 hypothetical protein E8D37_06820 [Nocardioides sp. GY 10127]
MTRLPLRPLDPAARTHDLRVEPGPRLLSADAGRRHAVPTLDLATLVAWAEDAGLRGRGGAGFPFAVKLATAGRGRRPVVVVNAAEGEPASAKDAVLLARDPHLVLDGAEVAARALGAREVHVVLPGDRPATAAVAAAAVAARTGPRWRTSTAAPRFVSGQSTAVVQLLSGRPGLPVTAWAPDAVSGLRGRPTLLSNAETWAQLAVLARSGPEAYRALGTPDEPGTTLLSVVGAEGTTVVEAEHGTPFPQVLGAGEAPTEGVEAPLLLGGFHGTWLAPDQVARARVSRVDGTPLGAGVVLVQRPGRCPLALTAGIVEHLAGQSARRCGPCVHGLPALADAVVGMLHGREGARQRAEALAGLLPGRGACAHPDGTARLVRSLLLALPREIEAHERGGCSAAAPAVSPGRPSLRGVAS